MDMTGTANERAPEGEQATGSEQATTGTVHPDPLALLQDVEVEVTLEIGRRRMKIADVVRLGPGKTLELDKQAGEPLELLVNGRLIGRGEAVVIGDRYAIRIVEIVGPQGSGGAR